MKRDLRSAMTQERLGLALLSIENERRGNEIASKSSMPLFEEKWETSFGEYPFFNHASNYTTQDIEQEAHYIP